MISVLLLQVRLLSTVTPKILTSVSLCWQVVECCWYTYLHNSLLFCFVADGGAVCRSTLLQLEVCTLINYLALFFQAEHVLHDDNSDEVHSQVNESEAH